MDTTIPGFYMGTADSNAWNYVCMTDTLPTEPSLQHFLFQFEDDNHPLGTAGRSAELFSQDVARISDFCHRPSLPGLTSAMLLSAPEKPQRDIS